MVVRLSPLQFTCSMSGNFHKSHPVIFYWARQRNFDANQLVIGHLSALAHHNQTCRISTLSYGSMSSGFTAVNRAMGKAWA